MEKRNQSTNTEFLILSLTDNPMLQFPLFIVFLLIYLTTLFGNTSIITLVCIDCHLHTPMYAFLCNLSIIDVCYTSVTLPKLMQIHFTQNNAISFNGCMTQQYFFCSIAIAEYHILAVMAFDRYVAICKPLHYTIIMTRKVCFLLSSISWTSGFLSSLPISFLTSGLSFCRSNVINHLMCDVKPLMQLSCSDTRILEIVIFIVTMLYAFCPFVLICTSYIYIIMAILNIRSSEGRQRAFSTCSSHLIVFSLFCVIMICTYAGPASVDSLEKDKVLALLYVAVIPMLNPIIYSLRNREVKFALTRNRKHFVSNVQQKCGLCISQNYMF
ncbi:olfactory receptor 5AR1-like [Ambystoma mexicanum]|uniref:olfactory receptor 5AR1-like n=1 Tax=Ambystoma mexicanum TaxID=8296 RepID=UPI0037E89489